MEHGRVKNDKQEVEMELEIKVTRKSISSHWFLNVFLVMAAAVIILETVLCLSL